MVIVYMWRLKGFFAWFRYDSRMLILGLFIAPAILEVGGHGVVAEADLAGQQVQHTAAAQRRTPRPLPGQVAVGVAAAAELEGLSPGLFEASREAKQRFGCHLFVQRSSSASWKRRVAPKRAWVFGPVRPSARCPGRSPRGYSKGGFGSTC